MVKYIFPIISIVLIFIHIYNFQLVYIPFVPRTLMSAVGIFAFFMMKKKLGHPKIFRQLLFLCILLVAWGVSVCAVNNSSEMIYNNVLKNYIAVFLSAVCISFFARKTIAIENLFFIVVAAVLLENVIAAIGFFVPRIGQLLMDIQPERLVNAKVSDITEYYRLVGLGNAYFFGVLPSCAIGLMCSSYLIAMCTARQKVFAIIAYIIIGVTCVLTARTSTFLIAISFFGIFIYDGKKKISLKTIVLVGIVLILVYFGLLALKDYLPDVMVEWLFGFSGSEGQRELITWWTDTSYELKTLLVGDGHYMVGEAYYKEIDVGYFRQIYYGGVLGLGMKIALNYLSIHYLTKVIPTREIKIFTILFFLCYLVIMAKGDGDIYIVSLMLLVICDYNLRYKVNRR